MQRGKKAGSVFFCSSNVSRLKLSSGNRVFLSFASIR